LIGFPNNCLTEHGVNYKKIYQIKKKNQLLTTVQR